MAKRRNPVDENKKIAEDAASAYVRDKGFSESSLEAVRRAAKANKRKSRVKIGGYWSEI